MSEQAKRILRHVPGLRALWHKVVRAQDHYDWLNARYHSPKTRRFNEQQMQILQKFERATKQQHNST